MTAVLFLFTSFVWGFHFLTAPHWDSKVNLTIEYSPNTLPFALGHAVPSAEYAFPSSPWVVILSTAGYISNRKVLRRLYLISPTNTGIFSFEIHSSFGCRCFCHISLLTSYAAYKRVHFSCHPLPACRLFEGRSCILFISIFPVEALHILRFQYVCMFIYMCVYSSLILF